MILPLCGQSETNPVRVSIVLTWGILRRAAERTTSSCHPERTDLLLHPQRRLVSRERTAIDRLVVSLAEDVVHAAAKRLCHVSTAPIALRDPVTEIRTSAALQMTGRSHPYAEDADRRLFQRDRKTRLRILAVRRRLLADETLHVLSRIGPGRRTEPADHVPICEQREQGLIVPLPHRTQRQPRGSSRDASLEHDQAPLCTLPQLLSEAQRPRSRRKRSTGADEASARMR